MIKEKRDNKVIVHISEIGSNKFNIKLEDDKKEEKIDKNVNMEKYRLRRSTIGNKLRKDESQNEGTKKDNKKKVYNILLEIDQDEKTDEITLKSTYEFYQDFDIIGRIGT